MFKPKNTVDITGSYKAMENLKLNLLRETAGLYESMQPGGLEAEEVAGILADMIINSYLLCDKIGIEYDQVNTILKNKLKLMAVDNDGETYNIADLYKHIESRSNK